MKKYININGVNFEFVKSRKEDEIIKNSLYNLKTLNQCYAKPSETKISIYNKWRAFFNSDNIEAFTFGVSTYNVSNFTLICDFVYNNKYYITKITKTYNKIIEICDFETED